MGTFSSCEDMFGHYLDKQPSNELSEEDVFSSWKNTQAYYYDIYNFLRNGLAYINNSWMDAATDLAENSYSWGGTRSSFNIGNYYAAGGAPEITATWEHYFRGIRKCNTLLQKIDAVPLDADETSALRQATANRMKAEARFFRAYFYWELCLRYGALPIIEVPLDPEDESINDLPRPSSVKDNYAYILQELTACYADLEDDLSIAAANLGRITKGVNLALQSRIKLYLASPRYQDLGLATWQDAADAAQLFIDQFGEGTHYHLYTAADAPSAYSLAITRRVFDGNPEVIFWRNDAVGDWWPNESPVGYGGNGGLCPSQNLVDMYDMANGTSPFISYDDTGAPVYLNGQPTVAVVSGYDDQKPYANRDPRFYRTVLYNGATWWNRAINTQAGGTDNPTGNANATPTSYYNRKYLDDSQTNYLTGGTMYRNWIFIRYAEILLNFAEAENELNGPSDAVFSALQKLRDRVGLTALLSSRTDLKDKTSLRRFIHKERTVELAFENHRSWDVRRWNVAKEALSRPIYGLTITSNGQQVNYERKVSQTRIFEDKMYLYPIPEEEVWKTGIANNLGW
ncbi:Starch-binding associating with outer membrane [bacterium A37T11]|nr:Starch-binding associating with outer membrane [bacterium A37T11]